MHPSRDEYSWAKRKYERDLTKREVEEAVEEESEEDGNEPQE